MCAVLIQGVWYVLWLSAAVFIFSVGTPVSREGFPFITEMKWDDNTRGVLAYMIFALLWVNAYIEGFVQFIIGAGSCIWYFNVKSPGKGRGSTLKAMKWAFKWHWASIAMGSLIIAICTAIRLIFEYFRKKMGAADKTIPWIKALFCMTRCCLECLERCIKYITKNAYIQIALTSDSFPQAALNAVALIIKHAHRFGFVNTIGSVFMFFGVITVTAVCGVSSYFFLDNYKGFETTSPIPATVVISIISGLISVSFLSVFSFSQDAILQSFLLDETLTNGEGDNRPDHMTKFMNSLSQKARRCCGCC